MGFGQWLKQVDEDMLTPRHPRSWTRSTLGVAWTIYTVGLIAGIVLLRVALPLGVTIIGFSIGGAIYTWWRRKFGQDPRVSRDGL